MICIAGAVVSNINGDQLFAGELKGGKGYSYTFSGEDVNKIDIEASDATVNIIGGSTESKLEVINFDENMYALNIDPHRITFKESPDVKSMLNFFENGVTFKGMRYVMRLGGSSGEKIINIYLTNKDRVDKFILNVGKGKISVEDIKTDTEYSFTILDGAVSMNNIKTGGSVSVSALQSSDLDIALNKVSAKALKIDAAYAELTSETLTFSEGKINITHGSAQLDFIPLSHYFKLNINANGKLTVNDNPYTSTYSYENLPPVTDTPTEDDTTSADIPKITIDGRELSVYLKGDCFEGATEETTDNQ